MLNTETDTLEESNKEIKDHIQKILERGQLSEKERENLQQSLETECESIEAEIDRKYVNEA
jgi:hypothetical protein